MAKKSRTPLGAALATAANGTGSAKLAAEGLRQSSKSADSKRTAMGANTTRADRVGRVNVTGYFDPAVKASFRLIQAKHPDRTLQDLLGEALDDLFAKYGVPQSAKLS